jgi:hypothetical protein
MEELCIGVYFLHFLLYALFWEMLKYITNPNPLASGSDLIALVEHTGFEPVTSTLPVWHSSQLS